MITLIVDARTSDTIIPKYFMVPYEKNVFFVGHDDFIDQIFNRLCESKPYQYNHRIALYGMGGVGKTQTALAYVHTLKQNYHSIFWISGVTQATLLSGFEQIRIETRCAVELNPTETAKLVIKWLQEQTNWLLVIDNLDDISVIEGFLPSTDCNGHTIITTRNPSTEGIPAQGIEVEVLDIETAVQLFRILLNPPESEFLNDELEIRTIVKELGCLPLAIEQAAAFIRESNRRINEYLPLYQKNRSTRQKLQKWTPKGNRKYHYSVATAWKMSFDYVKQNSESSDAALLLQLLAFLNPDLILLKFLQSGSNGLDENLHNLLNDTVELDEALRVLAQFSLIKRVQSGQGIWIHRLIQEAIQHDLEEEDLPKWWEKVAKLCLYAFPKETNETTRPHCRSYEEQVYIPLSKSPQINSNTLALSCARVGLFLGHDGKYKQAEILCEKAYNTYRGIQGERHPDTLTAMANLASTYWNQGRWDEAVTLQEKVLEVSKAVLGERHPSTLTAMANLASTYWNQGRWDEAVTLQEKVLEVSKAVLGERHPSTLTAMANLASTYRNQGRWDEAVTLDEKVLEVSKAVLGERHPATLTAMANLASTYWNQGRWDEAVTLQEKVLEVSKAVLGERHPDTLTAMANLASTYWNQGRWDEAVTLQEKVLEVSKAVLGERHPATLTAMANLASTYWNQGRWDEAVTLQEKVLEVRKAVLGERHPSTLTAMANLALTYWNQGRWDEAVTLQEKVLEVSKAVLGERHPSTLTAMANLASTYWNQGRWDEAVTLQEKVLEVSKAVLGERHPSTLTAMANLALTYWRQGRRDEAVVFQQTAVKDSKSVFGERHPDTIQCINNLLFMKQNQSSI